MGWTVLGWEAPFFESRLKGSLAVRLMVSISSRITGKRKERKLRRKEQRGMGTGVEIPRGEILVVSKMCYDIIQGLVLSDVQIVTHISLAVPFVDHFGRH